MIDLKNPHSHRKGTRLAWGSRQAATIGRVGQTDESNASLARWQFECSYRTDKPDFILKPSALSHELSATPVFAGA